VAQTGCPFHNLGGGCPYREFGRPAGGAAPIETVGTAQDHCVAHVHHINWSVVAKRAPGAGSAPARAGESAGAGQAAGTGGSVGGHGDGNDSSDSGACAAGTAPSASERAAHPAKRARPLPAAQPQPGRAAAVRADDLAAQGFQRLENG
jgi:hypothetical protein